jgi:hypothetical protein
MFTSAKAEVVNKNISRMAAYNFFIMMMLLIKIVCKFKTDCHYKTLPRTKSRFFLCLRKRIRCLARAAVPCRAS